MTSININSPTKKKITTRKWVTKRPEFHMWGIIFVLGSILNDREWVNKHHHHECSVPLQFSPIFAMIVFAQNYRYGTRWYSLLYLERNENCLSLDFNISKSPLKNIFSLVLYLRVTASPSSVLDRPPFGPSDVLYWWLTIFSYNNCYYHAPNI